MKTPVSVFRNLELLHVFRNLELSHVFRNLELLYVFIKLELLLLCVLFLLGFPGQCRPRAITQWSKSLPLNLYPEIVAHCTISNF